MKMYSQLLSLLLVSVYIPFYFPSGAIQGTPTGTDPLIRAFDGDDVSYFATSQTGTNISGVSWIGVLYPSGEPVITGPFFVVLNQCHASNSLTSVKYQIHTNLGWSAGTAVTVADGVNTFTANVTGTYDGFRLMADSNLTGSNRWRVCELGLYMKQPDPVAQADTPTPTITPTPGPTATPTMTPTPDYGINPDQYEGYGSNPLYSFYIVVVVSAFLAFYALTRLVDARPETAIWFAFGAFVAVVLQSWQQFRNWFNIWAFFYLSTQIVVEVISLVDAKRRQNRGE